MGGILSSPIESQLIKRQGNGNFMVASSEMQGSRIQMEDAHCIRMPLSQQHPDINYFGVFDGHGGEKAAIFLSEHLHARLAALSEPTDKDALTQMVTKVDEEFLSSDQREQGSTCVFAVIRVRYENGAKMYDVTVANVGDSRVLVLAKDGTFRAMTSDHKPDLEAESKRIIEAGGFVRMNRVDGQLAMSRAVGDSVYKSDSRLPGHLQKVIPVPDISTHTACEGDAVLICCDGIVEQMTNDDVNAVLRQALANSPDDPALALQELFRRSLTAQSKDNHTALLLLLRDGAGYERAAEFIPGPFFHNKDNETFVNAYIADAKKHGYEGEKLVEAVAAKDQVAPEAIRQHLTSPRGARSGPGGLDAQGRPQFFTATGPGGTRTFIASPTGQQGSGAVSPSSQQGMSRRASFTGRAASIGASVSSLWEQTASAAGGLFSRLMTKIGYGGRDRASSEPDRRPSDGGGTNPGDESRFARFQRSPTILGRRRTPSASGSVGNSAPATKDAEVAPSSAASSSSSGDVPNLELGKSAVEDKNLIHSDYDNPQPMKEDTNNDNENDDKHDNDKQHSEQTYPDLT